LLPHRRSPNLTLHSPEIIAKTIDSPEPEAPTTAEIAIEEQAKAEVAKPKTEAEERAEKVTDAQIKRYWKSKEDERKAPRGETGVDDAWHSYTSGG
jgi:DNA polymerase delta subunit 4